MLSAIKDLPCRQREDLWVCGTSETDEQEIEIVLAGAHQGCPACADPCMAEDRSGWNAVGG